MFFVISGWLYSNREFNSVSSVVGFYHKNAAKLLVDYYVYISVLVLFFRSINKVPDGVIKLFYLSGTVRGLEHLWFIKYILVCYLLTPVLAKVISFCEKKNLNILLIFVVPVVVALLCKIFGIVGAWINCFYFGMILAHARRFKCYAAIVCIACLSAIALNLLQVYLQYFVKLNLYAVKSGHYLCEYAHVFLGIFCFYLFSGLYKRFLASDKCQKFLELTDLYSYDVYLTHQIYILGAYSIFVDSRNFFVSSLQLIVTICFSAYVLNLFSKYVKMFISKCVALFVNT